MIDVVYGKRANPKAVQALVEAVSEKQWDGTLYIGYPVFSSDDGVAATDALLTCKEHGVVIFDLSPVVIENRDLAQIAEEIEIRQNDLYRGLYTRLFVYRELTKNRGRDLAFNIQTITLLPDEIPGLSDLAEYATPVSLSEDLSKLDSVDEKIFKYLNAAIQRTAALKPKKKRLSVERADSKGALIKRIEAEIANLDQWQKKAAIECPDGPQRIRGLAGSGKTIILALKAAYLHANYPNADIVITFQTRSLIQQFESLISKFYYDQMQDDPNWERIKILHGWGSTSNSGVYSSIAKQAGAAPMTFGEARYRFGYSNAFEGACKQLLEQVQEREIVPMWDFVLIDEAQDFPGDFFRLVYKATRNPKRIVWAYDELQNLGDYAMPPASELFGLDGQGNPVITIENIPGLPKQDILLPICYRNSGWTLSFALSLGLGVYRTNGPVQMFDEPGIWEDIGYELAAGNLSLGSNVTLRRRSDRSPEFFRTLLQPKESIQHRRFASEEDQAQWIAEQIYDGWKTQELDLNDFLVVIPDAMSAGQKAQKIAKALRDKGVASHVVGVTSSRDLVFVDDSVAICGIYRAKGNEAPCVFVASAEYCFAGGELSKRRNVLFTAITRSKAWVRVCGVGPNMDGLIEEMVRTEENDYQLSFRYPTEDEIKQMRRSYREKSEAEKQQEKIEFQALRGVLEKLSSGTLDFGDLPEDISSLLRSMGNED